MKVALVHDYLREYGGAERVLEDLHDIFPDAPVFSAFYYPQGLGAANERIKKWQIHSSWIQKLPFANILISPLRILAGWIFENFDLSDFDVVISSDAIYFAKAVLTKPSTLHIAYIHTPPRYLYGFTTSYNYKKHWWTRIGGEFINHFLRLYDFEVSQRPDILVANSKNIAARIKKFYRRDSVVIPPGTDLGEFKNITKKNGDYYLSLGRLVRSKGVEVAIETANKLQVNLKVAGVGPLLDEFKKLAGPTVQILGSVNDSERVKLLTNAKALFLLEEEPDFGITSVEAQAAGTPVIAVRSGGYLETVVEGKTGEFIEQATVTELSRAIQNFDSSKYNISDLRQNAEKFSKERFKKDILALIHKNLPKL